MRRASSSLGDLFTFGGRVPAAVGGLIAAVVLASLFGAIGRGLALVENGALVPALVWQGQLWRLVTWVFFERNPLYLLLAALTLYWFGKDLCYAWGPRRFLATFFGVAIGAAAITCLVARVWPAVDLSAAIGPWAVLTALIIAWAMIFPERQILFMMALPMSGRALLWVTLGGTVLYAVFDPPYASYVPHISAQLLMVAYARGWSLRGFWQTLRIKQYERRARRRASHLKVVKKEDPPKWMN